MGFRVTTRVLSSELSETNITGTIEYKSYKNKQGIWSNPSI